MYRTSAQCLSSRAPSSKLDVHILLRESRPPHRPTDDSLVHHHPFDKGARTRGEPRRLGARVVAALSPPWIQNERKLPLPLGAWLFVRLVPHLLLTPLGIFVSLTLLPSFAGHRDITPLGGLGSLGDRIVRWLVNLDVSWCWGVCSCVSTITSLNWQRNSRD